jgi:hypothetical protein
MKPKLFTTELNVTPSMPNYVFKPTAMRHFVLTICRRVAAA